MPPQENFEFYTFWDHFKDEIADPQIKMLSLVETARWSVIQSSHDRLHAAARLINKHADSEFSPCSSCSDETEPTFALLVLAIKQSNVDCMTTRAGKLIV